MTLAGINIDLPAMMKEIRQTGFPIVLVGFIGLGGHHWATRYFDEVIVLESRAKIAMIEGVQQTNTENARQLQRIAESLDRLALKVAAVPLAAPAVVDGGQGQGAHDHQAKVEPNAARFEFGQHLGTP
jgi:hypothetical protein